MLNLIIVYANDTWLRSPAFLERERCLTEYILPELKEHYSGLTVDVITEIKQFPCIFAYENFNKKDALIGNIKNIEVLQKNVRIDYELTGEKIAFEDLIQLSNILDMGSWEWNRTHWTLKKASLEDIRPYFISSRKSSEKEVKENKEYNIALSFAGEDREYVEKIADKLNERGIRVFYDRYETGYLWGKDLYQHLNDVYKNKAEYCITFISKHYMNKLWTRHELRSAQSRAFKENKEYILPIVLDDTKIGDIEGFNDTIGYIEAKNFTYTEIVNLIEDKLGSENNIFWQCKDIKDLFEQSIIKITEISQTDYNQIILYASTGSYSYGLIVVADAISYGKQKYRIVVMDGIINKCFKSGKIMNIGNINNEQGYFQAVYETKSELVIPIRNSGNVIGVINIESEEINYFKSDKIEELNVISKHIGKMLEASGMMVGKFLSGLHGEGDVIA